MKLFKRLLVAPAALGLLSPMAADAADLNINGVSGYSSQNSAIQSVSNFSDIYPTDWTYQALNRLAERSECATAMPNSSLTRYEAASLLNRCLDKLSDVNSEERRLLNEFEPELAVIRGNLEGIEAGVGTFEASQFSTTTTLSGTTKFIVGAIDGLVASTGASGDGTNTTHPHSGEAATFTYDTILDLDTSFNGDDLLKTRVRSGNIGDSDPFGCSGVTPLETCFDSANLQVARLYYQFPVGDDFSVTVGPKVRQDDLLAVWPSAYPSDSVLDVLTYAGAHAAYGLAEGAGAGLNYTNGNISTSLLFVSEGASDANASGSTTVANTGGMLTDGGSDDYSAQIAWTGEGLTIAAIYTAADGGNTTGNADANDYTAYGISAVYEIDNSGTAILPSSISGGMGWKTPDNESESGNIEDENTWTLGLLWNDVGVEGNTLGVAVGTAEGHRDDSGYDDPLAYEVFYQMAVSDNITVTPAVFVVEKDNSDEITGGLIKTTFSF